LGDQPSQDFVLFNEAIKAKIAAMQKMDRSNIQINKSKAGTN
jgi:hypothetical protein